MTIYIILKLYKINFKPYDDLIILLLIVLVTWKVPKYMTMT